jgi:DNA repair protein RadC
LNTLHDTSHFRLRPKAKYEKPSTQCNSIKSWPESQRPRERLAAVGASQLTDAELLAIFLRTGVSGKNALTLAAELIASFGSLHAIANASQQEFCKTKGLGLAKWANLTAAKEITKRSLQNSLEERTILKSPQTVKDYLRLWFTGQTFESFVALFLDSQHRLIEAKELFRGTINQTAVYPREVVKTALGLNAAAIIVSHNHPSGLTEPSAADRCLTNSLGAALGTVDIRLLDHVIVAGNQTLSFAEKGLL